MMGPSVAASMINGSPQVCVHVDRRAIDPIATDGEVGAERQTE